MTIIVEFYGKPDGENVNQEDLREACADVYEGLSKLAELGTESVIGATITIRYNARSVLVMTVNEEHTVNLKNESEENENDNIRKRNKDTN